MESGKSSSPMLNADMFLPAGVGPLHSILRHNSLSSSADCLLPSPRGTYGGSSHIFPTNTTHANATANTSNNFSEYQFIRSPALPSQASQSFVFSHEDEDSGYEGCYGLYEGNGGDYTPFDNGHYDSSCEGEQGLTMGGVGEMDEKDQKRRVSAKVELLVRKAVEARRRAEEAAAIAKELAAAAMKATSRAVEAVAIASATKREGEDEFGRRRSAYEEQSSVSGSVLATSRKEESGHGLLATLSSDHDDVCNVSDEMEAIEGGSEGGEVVAGRNRRRKVMLPQSWSALPAWKKGRQRSSIIRRPSATVGTVTWIKTQGNMSATMHKRKEDLTCSVAQQETDAKISSVAQEETGGLGSVVEKDESEALEENAVTLKSQPDSVIRGKNEEEKLGPGEVVSETRLIRSPSNRERRRPRHLLDHEVDMDFRGRGYFMAKGPRRRSGMQ